MAAIDTIRATDFGALNYALQLVEAFIRNLSKRNELRKTQRVLLGLDDNQLEDIGLTRGDVAEFAFNRS